VSASNFALNWGKKAGNLLYVESIFWRAQVSKTFSNFKRGVASVKDDGCSGLPSICKTDEYVHCKKELDYEYKRITI
jgi:hypothetical protein